MQNHSRYYFKLFSLATATTTLFATTINQAFAKQQNYKEAKSIYEFTVKNLEGKEVSLEKYRGHVCIILNVACECGYTKKHYEELNELYQKYSNTKGLKILAFPCNQFGGQEPGDSNAIRSFVNTMNVKFDMFEKIDVNGDKAHPLWKYLQHKQGGIMLTNLIKWNFTKFIIDKKGQPVARFGPNISPTELVDTLNKYCFQKASLTMTTWKEANSIYDFNAKTINKEDISLEKYKGHVCIMVNVASECGYAKLHYEELNELYEKYSSKGLRILGFPCNQFGGQEPGDSSTICSFINTKNVKFDMYEKINVNGDDAHPLWNYLKHKQSGIWGDSIKWNFSKFVIDKNGQPVGRYGPNTSPKELVSILQKYL